LYQKRQELQNSRPLPNIALNKIRESLSLEWTYNSNSIEGNTLSLRETQMVIQEGITIKGKSLREHFETHNHDKAIDLEINPWYFPSLKTGRKADFVVSNLRITISMLSSVEIVAAGAFITSLIKVYFTR
jgi:hypothetical protein